MTDDAARKSAFVCSMGQFEWCVMPMGLTNAPCTFQRVMDDALRDLNAPAGVYLDDLIVYSASGDAHLHHLRSVFTRLR